MPETAQVPLSTVARAGLVLCPPAPSLATTVTVAPGSAGPDAEVLVLLRVVDRAGHRRHRDGRGRGVLGRGCHDGRGVPRRVGRGGGVGDHAVVEGRHVDPTGRPAGAGDGRATAAEVWPWGSLATTETVAPASTVPEAAAAALLALFTGFVTERRWRRPGRWCRACTVRVDVVPELPALSVAKYDTTWVPSPVTAHRGGRGVDGVVLPVVDPGGEGLDAAAAGVVGGAQGDGDRAGVVVAVAVRAGGQGGGHGGRRGVVDDGDGAAGRAGGGPAAVHGSDGVRCSCRRRRRCPCSWWP